MEKFIDIITSPKIYLPIIYIVLGVILNAIVSKVVGKIANKGNNGKDKRKITIINLAKSIVKYFILIFSSAKPS